jgi:hypothetical protein
LSDGEQNNVNAESQKRLFPLTLSDYYGFLFVVIGLMIVARGGIGGGGMLVPIYMLVMGFAPKQAIPLSNVTIVGGAIANTFLNVRKRHPLADRPLIDYDLTLGGSTAALQFVMNDSSNKQACELCCESVFSTRQLKSYGGVSGSSIHTVWSL